MRFPKIPAPIRHEVVAWFLFIGVFALLSGCVNSLQSFVQEDDNSELVNYALASYGTEVYVSEENQSHPANTLNNGITASDGWEQGEGWETRYDGPYAYGRYFAYGQNTVVAASAALSRDRYARLQGEQVEVTQLDPRDYEEKDDNWRGLRGNDAYSGGVQSAFGWVVLEFPEHVRLNRVVVHTVDSEEYPAAFYGVSHVRVQYWTESSVASGWTNVDRYNKKVGQSDDSIKDIKAGRVTFRFRPVKTRKIRVAVLWTNDAERYRNFGQRHYSRGTVRLVEIEAYGLEKAAQEEADTALEDESEQLLDSIFADGETAAEEVPVQQQMERAIRSYADAYQSGDVSALMNTISLNYDHEGEGRESLRERMARLFRQYPQPNFVLEKLEPHLYSQTVDAHYRLHLDGSSQPLSGALQFTLEQMNDQWQIREIKPIQ